MLLGIDTATNLAGIALMDERGSRGAIQWQSERNHTVELLPNIITLFAQAGVQATDLKAVAVAIGPGSYTGLRIGLSVAKGFCLAHSAALIAVPTLDISAQAYPPRASRLCAVLQAGRRRLAAAFYQVASGKPVLPVPSTSTALSVNSVEGSAAEGWQVTGDGFVGRADELAAACADQQTFFVGEVDEASEKILREQLGKRASFAPPSESARDPHVLARLGWERWQRGQTERIETLVPVYGQ